MLTTVAIFTLATTMQGQAPRQASAPAPYVVHVQALGADAARQARDGLQKLANIARVKVDTNAKRIQVWARQAEGAARPALLSNRAIRSVLASIGLDVGEIAEPKWSKVQVYVVEAAGGG